MALGLPTPPNCLPAPLPSGGGRGCLWMGGTTTMTMMSCSCPSKSSCKNRRAGQGARVTDVAAG